jgi:hypothetical protein
MMECSGFCHLSGSDSVLRFVFFFFYKMLYWGKLGEELGDLSVFITACESTMILT